ncbi:MAG: STAS domain-containing protein [Gammaproteobacteria bacterium]
MSKVEITDQGSGVFTVAGELTFSGIDKTTLKSIPILKSANPIILDLGQVSSTDSAGLALIIEWIKYARNHKIKLKFQNIPEQLMTLAKLSGLDRAGSFELQG